MIIFQVPHTFYEERKLLMFLGYNLTYVCMSIPDHTDHFSLQQISLDHACPRLEAFEIAEPCFGINVLHQWLSVSCLMVESKLVHKSKDIALNSGFPPWERLILFNAPYLSTTVPSFMNCRRLYDWKKSFLNWKLQIRPFHSIFTDQSTFFEPISNTHNWYIIERSRRHC